VINVQSRGWKFSSSSDQLDWSVFIVTSNWDVHGHEVTK
jgi:hypothetical protein